MKIFFFLHKTEIVFEEDRIDFFCARFKVFRFEENLILTRKFNSGFPFKCFVNLADPSNVYLPPPSSTDNPIVIHPPDDFDMSVYLPPFNEEHPPPQHDPPQYDPPQNDPPQNYLPPENVSISLIFHVDIFIQVMYIELLMKQYFISKTNVSE